MIWWKLKGFLLALVFLVLVLDWFDVLVVPVLVLGSLSAALAVVNYITKHYVLGSVWVVVAIYDLVSYFDLIS